MPAAPSPPATAWGASTGDTGEAREAMALPGGFGRPAARGLELDIERACMAGPFCGTCRCVVEHLLSQPPRRMNSARPGAMSRDRPQAAAERSEDRVRTVAKPAALDSGPRALCVGQEAASDAEATCTGRTQGSHHPRCDLQRRAIQAAATRNRCTPRSAAHTMGGLAGSAVNARPLDAPDRGLTKTPAIQQPSQRFESEIEFATQAKLHETVAGKPRGGLQRRVHSCGPRLSVGCAELAR